MHFKRITRTISKALSCAFPFTLNSQGTSCRYSTLRKVAIDLILLFILVSVPFIRVGSNGVIRPLDSDFPLNPMDQLHKYTYTWYDSGAMFGNDGSFTSITQIPYYLTPAFLSYIGLPINIVNRVTMIFYATIVAWAAYAMAYLLIPNRSRLTPILSGLLFFYNPYIMGEINLGHWFSILSYSALPIMLVAMIKGLNNSNWKKWALILGIVSVLAVPRVRFFPIILEVLCIYFVYWLLQNRSMFKLFHGLKFIIVTSFVVLVVNLWWILPTLANISSVLSLLVTPPTSNFSDFSFPTTFLSNYSFSNIVGLVGYGIPLDLSYGAYFQSLSFIIIEFGLMSFIFLGPILRRNHFNKFFTVILVLFLGLIISITYVAPIFSVYKWFSMNSPSPLNSILFPMGFEYRGIVIALSYAFLIGATYTEIVRSEKHFELKCYLSTPLHRIFTFVNNKKFFNKILGFFIVVLILASSWPLFGGVHNDFLEPVVIPSYYDKAHELLSFQPADFKVLTVPHPFLLYYIQAPWAYNGAKALTDFSRQILPVPVLYSAPGIGYGANDSNLLEMAYDNFPSISSQRLLSLLGVKYVIVRNDLIDNTFASSIFKNQTNYVLEKTVGELDFYRNKLYSPTVYCSTSLFAIWGAPDSLVPLTLSDLNMTDSAFIGLKDVTQKDREFWLNISKEFFVYDQLENNTILNEINEKTIHPSYVFNWTFPSSVTVAADDLYVLNTTTISDQNSKVMYLNLTKDELIHNPTFDFSLPSDSLSLFGTSRENDSATIQAGALLSDSTIDWRISGETGWHALYTLINQTQWNLNNLAKENGAIMLRMRGNNSGREIRFSFMGANGSRFVWPLQTIYLNWSGWKDMVLPLNNFEKIGSLNWSDPWALWIWEEVPPGTPDFSDLQISNITKLNSPSVSTLKPIGSSEPTVSTKTQIQVDKKSPVEYQIQVSSEKPFFLILDQAYNEGWTANINGTTLPHFKANFYANGYYVPTVGNFSISIVYPGQQYFVVGAFLSVTAINISAIYVVASQNIFLTIRDSKNRLCALTKTALRRLSRFLNN